MKAIVYHKYGSPDVLELKDIDMPVVRDDGVLVRVHAASINPLDWHFMRGAPYLVRMGAGLFKPKATRLGADVAGRGEAVGKNVTRLQVGDEVFGAGAGTFAEYAVAGQEDLAPKPGNVTFEQAAAVPLAGLTALRGLRDQGKVQAGQKVLIIGAGGGIGTFAVQIAKSFGAEVTGVCSTTKTDLVRAIGADHVIDYTKQDFTAADERYDLIMDNVSKHSLSRLLQVLTPKGVLLPNGGRFDKRWMANTLVLLIEAPLLSLFVSRSIRTIQLAPTLKDRLTLKELLESGTVTPVIGRTYPLSQTPVAIGYFGQGHALGKVVITV